MNNFTNWDREKDRANKYEFLEEMLKEVDEASKGPDNEKASDPNKVEDIQEMARDFLHKKLNKDKQEHD
jgi:hypothetical protein